MKLSGFEKTMLEKQLDIPGADVPVMCAAAAKTQHFIDGRRASRREAMEALGWADYMYVLHRATREALAGWKDKSGRFVALDASKWFMAGRKVET